MYLHAGNNKNIREKDIFLDKMSGKNFERPQYLRMLKQLKKGEIHLNPFEQKARPVDDAFTSWSKIYPCSYNKLSTDPYTKTRIILMNG